MYFYQQCMCVYSPTLFLYLELKINSPIGQNAHQTTFPETTLSKPIVFRGLIGFLTTIVNF